MSKYDALLIVSFGGPEQREDVIPFLENVLRGRNVPRERLLEVAAHYYHFEGRSPINDQNRALIAALHQVVKIPIYWGNRNWHPAARRHGSPDAGMMASAARWRFPLRPSAPIPAAANIWKTSSVRGQRQVRTRRRS